MPPLRKTSFAPCKEDMLPLCICACILTRSVGADNRKQAKPAPQPAMKTCDKLGGSGDPKLWGSELWRLFRSKKRSIFPYDTNKIAFRPAKPMTGDKTPLKSELICMRKKLYQHTEMRSLMPR